MCSMTYQVTHQGQCFIPPSYRPHKRSLAILISQVDIGSRFNQILNNVCVMMENCSDKWRPSEFDWGRLIDWNTLSNKGFDLR